MGITLTQKLFVGLITLNVFAISLFMYLLLSSFNENELFSPPAPVIQTKENGVIFCDAHHSLSYDTQHNCSLLDSLQLEDYVASGWTKVVHRSKINSIPVALKSVNIKGKDITDCTWSKPILECYNDAVEKFGREIDMLRKLNDESIIKLGYYCYKTEGQIDCMKHALLATELGEPLTNIKLLQMSWRKRRVIIQDLASLIHYAQNSPLGSLRLADLRRPQFVLLNGRLKLVDLDDVFVGEPACFSDVECSGRLIVKLV